ncbi:MAG: (d)CMP kinase [Candidatus Kryptoniota bacterium]
MIKLLIAIDGPAGSGKTTTARLLAERLSYTYLDTGAMYRAITFKVLQMGVMPKDEVAVVEIARKARLNLKSINGSLHIFLDGEDVTEKIRSEDVTQNVSLISSYAGVRELMVEKQREIGAQKGCVVDGRDIGTVVFPDADLKFFMIADIAERARRRQLELAENGRDMPIAEVVRQIQERDEMDSNRGISPLRRANDAILIDTTKMSVEEQVEEIMRYVREKITASNKEIKYEN